MTWFLATCLVCNPEDDPLPMPFITARARGKWCAEHTESTTHQRWDIQDRPEVGGLIPPGRGDGRYTDAPFWKKGTRG